MPHHILYLIDSLGRAGAEHNVAMYCKHADKARYLPEVWVLNPGLPLEEIVRAAGVEVDQLRRGSKWNPWGAVRAAGQIARAKCDLIQANLPTIATYAALAKLLFRIPQPMVFRCGWTFDSLPAVRWRYGWLYRRTFDAFFANSPSSAAFLTSMGIEPERIQIIPNAHEMDRFIRPICRQSIRSDLGIKPDATLLIYVGRLSPRKRVCDFVEAISLIAPRHPKLRALIVGEGPERPAIEHQIAKLDLEQQIGLTGSRGDVPDLLRSSDLFVFPSERGDGLSNAVIEACLAGLPIVACDAPGVRDVVRHEREALLAQPHNPRMLAEFLLRLLEEPDDANRLATAAKLKAEKTYRIESSMYRLYELYDELLGAEASGVQQQTTPSFV